MENIVKVFNTIEKGVLITEGKYQVPYAYRTNQGQLINSHKKFFNTEKAQQFINNHN